MVRVNCDQCSQVFNTKKLFVSHLINKLCHKSIREAAKSQSRNKEETFDYPTLEIVPLQDCSWCRLYSKPGMQMYMLAHLTRHVKSPAAFFECEVCKARFESQYYLDKHENKKHRNEKCEECPKKFKTKTLLRKHLEDSHSKGKCGMCDFVAVGNESLDNHVYLKHPEEDTCNECGMAFENSIVLESHFADVHEKFSCNECDDEFESEESLNDHCTDAHGHSKTTFKQFGGGNMMMMMMVEEPDSVAPVSESVESHIKDDNELDSNSNIDEVNSVVEETSYGFIKEIILEIVNNASQSNSPIGCDSAGRNSDNDQHRNCVNVFSKGFFMMYSDISNESEVVGESYVNGIKPLKNFELSLNDIS